MGNAAFTEADGRQLAVDMLREIADQWGEDDERFVEADSSIADNFDRLIEAKISRDPDIFRRYLSVVRNNPTLERGFLCVLTEFLGSAVAGCPLDLEDLDEHVR